MRPISATLMAAQQSASGAPLVQAILRARRGNANRLDPITLYSAAIADAPTALALPANGNVVRARLSGGSVQTQALAPAPGSAWATWTTLAAAIAPIGGVGVALAAIGDTVTIAYLSAAATIAVRDSANDGVSFSAGASLSAASPILDVAVAYAPSGDLLLVAGDSGGTLHAWRRPNGGNFGADASLVPPASSSISSAALAYSADWLALFGWSSGSQSFLSSAIYGNGGLQPAGTWSASTSLLGLAQGSGPALLAGGFAWGADGGHATLVEQWAITGGYTANPSYQMLCTSEANFAAGRWTEPEPFPYSLPSGGDFAVSQATAGLYAAAGHGLVQTLEAPADQDVSSRVIALRAESDSHHGTLELVLDNADGSLSGLATNPSSIGLRLDCSLGYSTAAGAEYAPQSQRWLTGVSSTWSTGRQVVTLSAADAWQLLHQFQPRRQYSFGPATGLALLSVDQLIAWLLMRAGVEYSSPASSPLRSRTPQFQIAPTHDGHAAMLELLDKIEGWLLLTATGASVIPLNPGDPVSYTYGPAAHPILQLFHQQEAQPANLISIYTGAHGQNLTAQAFDSADAYLGGAIFHEHSDTQLEVSNAQATANALLRKAQISGPIHTLTTLPNLAQELGDVVSLTDPLTGAPYSGRVRTQSIELDRDRGIWQQHLSLSRA